MTAHKAVIGLSLLSALFLCAFAAPNAMAIKGTTAFTCTPNGGSAPFYSDAHCTKTDGAGSFGTTALQTSTKVTATNNITGAQNSALKLTATVGGIKSKITATGFHSCANASGENKVNGAGQMFVEGTFCGQFTGVTVSEPLNCQVVGGTVTLNEGKAKSVVQVNGKGEEEMFGEFTPPASGIFATFQFGADAKCATKNLKVEVKGTARANVSTNTGQDDGATLKITEAETEQTLQIGGQKASVEGELTARMGETENPVAINTTAS